MNRNAIRGFKAYHAHVYFDANTSADARSLCKKAGTAFDIVVGRHHEKPIGPHPVWSCQLAFAAEVRDNFLRWLEAERGELTVFVHALSGNDLADHREHIFWLGAPVTLNLHVFDEHKRNKRSKQGTRPARTGTTGLGPNFD